MRTGQLKSGSYVLIDGFVCQVNTIDLSKPGKHGASKARVVATGVFDDQKRNLLRPATDESEVPMVDRSDAQVVADLGASVQIMDTKTYQTYDLPKPKDVAGLKAGDEVEYLKCDENLRITRKK